MRLQTSELSDFKRHPTRADLNEWRCIVLNAYLGICSDRKRGKTAAMLIYADGDWCRKHARRISLSVCSLVALSTAICVWMHPIDLRGESIWTVCVKALVILLFIGALFTMSYFLSLRHMIILSSWHLAHCFSIESRCITFESVAALTIEKDNKHQYWILRNASLPRKSIRVPIEAYPDLCKLIEDFKHQETVKGRQ
jgi:hypothetical protein